MLAERRNVRATVVKYELAFRGELETWRAASLDWPFECGLGSLIGPRDAIGGRSGGALSGGTVVVT